MTFALVEKSLSPVAGTNCPSCEQPMVREPGFFHCPSCHYGLSDECWLLTDALEGAAPDSINV